MPLYYFDTDDGEHQIRDHIGINLGFIDEVEAEAAGLLRDIAHLEMPVGRHMMTATVRDSEDVIVYRSILTITGRRYGPQDIT